MVFFFLQTREDICGIDFCRPAMKSQHNAVHNPVKIDSAPLISSN